MNWYLFPALRATPNLIEDAFARLPEEVWDTPTHPDRFTPREILAHLADWEPILLERMKQATLSPGTAITAYDEGKMSIDNGYAHWDCNQSIMKLKQAREETVEWLQSLTSPDWSLTVIHPERGVMSVYDMANTIVCHDIYHVEQLSTTA